MPSGRVGVGHRRWQVNAPERFEVGKLLEQAWFVVRRPHTLFFDGDGNLWTADKGHVYELRRGEDKFPAVDIPRGTVNQFVQLNDGTIWIVDAWKDVRPLHDDRRVEAVKIPGVPVMIAEIAKTASGSPTTSVG